MMIYVWKHIQNIKWFLFLISLPKDHKNMSEVVGTNIKCFTVWIHIANIKRMLLSISSPKKKEIIMLLVQTMIYVMNSYTKYTADVVFDIAAENKKLLRCWRKRCSPLWIHVPNIQGIFLFLKIVAGKLEMITLLAQTMNVLRYEYIANVKRMLFLVSPPKKQKNR